MNHVKPTDSGSIRPTLWILVALFFALPACESGVLRPLPGSETPPTIDFVVQDTTFAAGDGIEVHFANRSAHDIGYNFCHSAQLQRRFDRGWMGVRTWPDDVVCLAILYNLGPGESTKVSLPIREFVGSGLYRIRAPVRWARGQPEDEELILFSNAFRIVDD